VAKLPIQTYGILHNMAVYKIDESIHDSQNDGSTLISAPFLFIILFATWKLIIRKCIFINDHTRLVSESTLGISIPRKVFMKWNGSLWTSNESLEESLQNFLGYILSTWYSLYAIYKALKKYKQIKYVVSATRIASRITGYICSMYIPVPLRYVMYGSFAKVYGIDMSEVEYPDFGHYETFTLFFTRRLKKGARTISEKDNAKSMCSPCDGRVLTCGKINSEYSTIDCVKGRSYRLDEFMLGMQGESLENDKT
jgi:hypothetical protein